MNKLPFYVFGVLLFLFSCQSAEKAGKEEETVNEDDFEYLTEQFADVKIIRYRVPGFEDLSVQEKTLIYYLYEASLAGRDIMWDQNYKHNLAVRRTLEAVVKSGKGDAADEEYGKFMEYVKRVWFANGIHHHYGNVKFKPEFSREFFAKMVKAADPATLPLKEGQSVDDLLSSLESVIFDPTKDAKKVNVSPDVDQVANSAINFYEGVTQAEVEAYYEKLIDPTDETPVSYGLNTKVVKENGVVTEKIWKVGGMYSDAIERIAHWLDKAATVAENDAQQAAFEKLAAFYRSGDLKDFDTYSIAWVADSLSKIDLINGFIEVYNDPLGYKGSYESVVSIRDPEASKRIEAIGDEAQWFEDNSPIMDSHKKENVTGISAKVINVAMESGDASPSTPIGINLPNANWIRARHGSKSVNLANIVSAYDEASKTGGGSLAEFAWSEEEIKNTKEYGYLADLLHTDMHEVIGHASGQINPGIGTPKQTLKSYSSTLEEGRADLVGLYYILDPKLVELGLMPSLQVGRTGYDDYIRNGMMLQLRRLEPGDEIEEAHMRNRQLICHWAYEKGKEEKVIERKTRDGKTYFVINDYERLRELFGELLRELQRIKSEGDYEAGKALVENYGVKVDPEIHKEVLARYEKLNISPYGGFINPKLIPVKDGEEIIDVRIEYPADFTEQMLFYGEQYSLLPTYN